MISSLTNFARHPSRSFQNACKNACKYAINNRISEVVWAISFVSLSVALHNRTDLHQPKMGLLILDGSYGLVIAGLIGALIKTLPKDFIFTKDFIYTMLASINFVFSFAPSRARILMPVNMLMAAYVAKNIFDNFMGFSNKKYEQLLNFIKVKENLETPIFSSTLIPTSSSTLIPTSSSTLIPTSSSTLIPTSSSTFQKVSSLFFGESKKLNMGKMIELLDKNVVGQKHAKETIVQAVYFHFNQEKETVIPKGNVLLVGPSGSGKTFIVETLCKELEIPMATLDISKVTPEGYSGPKIRDVFVSLLAKTGNNVEKASQGIVFFDEIDKQFKADSKDNNLARFNPPGQALLNQLLCILQEGEIVVSEYDNDKIINTKNILFIFAGAFHDLTNTLEEGTLTDEHLLNGGVRPEFLGRIGYISQLSPLGREDIKKVIRHGPNSVLPAWKQQFAQYGYELLLSEATIDKIVDEAMAKPTGARGIHFTLRRLLSPILAKLVLAKEQKQETEKEVLDILQKIEV